MKIQYASDFHLEFPDNERYLLAHPLQATGDVLVLAGDIHVLDTCQLDKLPFLRWCADHYERTLLVPGNHEYYAGHDLADTLIDWELPILPGVSMVNNRSVVLGDVELLFTTLWSRIPPQDQPLVNRCLTDCYRMVYRGERFQAHHYDEVHEQCLRWLTDALSASTAAHRVVVTHHCPVVKEDPRYQSNGLTNAFIVPLERFIDQSGVDAWIFGHTHYNGANGMRIGNTLMCSNQLGYVKDGIERGFNPEAVLDLSEKK
ncbi:MAG: metallophosphoesterase [Muribaculaceae bacterium]|nr:metallophosphoesterase [Muribaculaceae bacterium]